MARRGDSWEEHHIYMARHFNYYCPWKSELLTCPCGWRGTFEQGMVDYHKELLDSECPNCSTLVAVVHYPTGAEIERNEPRDGAFRRQVKEAEKRWSVFQSLRLQSPEQLPEIDDPEFVLNWDFAEDGLGEKWTVIRKESQEIFRELAFWEGWKRYCEVAAILKLKYGTRLLDLHPTEASLLYLLGDSFAASENIAQCRKACFPRAHL
jgi:hypothetical protein